MAIKGVGMKLKGYTPSGYGNRKIDNAVRSGKYIFGTKSGSYKNKGIYRPSSLTPQPGYQPAFVYNKKKKVKAPSYSGMRSPTY